MRICTRLSLRVCRANISLSEGDVFSWRRRFPQSFSCKARKNDLLDAGRPNCYTGRMEAGALRRAADAHAAKGKGAHVLWT